MSKLKDKKVAIVTESGFEEIELISTKSALEEADVTVSIPSPQKKSNRSWNQHQWGIELKIDEHISDASIDDSDALFSPDGVMDTNKLRKNKEAGAFTTSFLESGKPIASICHGPQTLIETGMLKGTERTSYTSIKTKLINAGVNWVDKEGVVDDRLITSRFPEIRKEFAHDVHQSSFR